MGYGQINGLRADRLAEIADDILNLFLGHWASRAVSRAFMSRMMGMSCVTNRS